MTRKFLTVFVAVLFLLPVLSLAQSQALLFPDGDLKILDAKDNDLKKESKKQRRVVNNNVVLKRKIVKSYLSAGATADTLATRKIIGGGPWQRFGWGGQDWFIQWYVAPADMDIVAIGFAPSGLDDADAGANVELKIVKMAWTAEELHAITQEDQYLGYYEADGNGKHDVTALMGNPDLTGGWVDAGNAATSPFGEDLWSDYGLGAPVPITSDDIGSATDPDYVWAQMLSLGFQPSLVQGEVFGVVVHAMGALGGDGGDLFGNSGFGVGAFKFYGDGRLTAVDYGWWARTWSWDVVAAVSLTGDRAPVIDVDQLSLTVSTSARTVNATIADDNPAGGDAGVFSAELFYSVDGGDFTLVTMTGTEPDYTAEIPGQAAGADVTYYVEAADVLGNVSRTGNITYSIYAKTEDVLFVYNVDDFSESDARSYYMGVRAGTPVGHDYYSTASFGVEIFAEVLAMYDNAVQVDGSFPSYDLTEFIEPWIQMGTSGAPKRYFLSSQDYGCVLDPDCADITFEAGSFLYDYLGVSGVTNQDWPALTPSVQGDPWLVTPVVDDPVSGWVATYNADSSVSHYYDPAYETGITNYMDNLDVADAGNATVTFTSQDSAGSPQTAGVRNNGDGFYTAYISYDFASTNFRANLDSSQGTDPNYAWAIDVASQVAEFLAWGGFSAIETDLEISPRAYDLAQNYPNPFNPTTTIKYTLASQSKISLKVFDLQGREVATLVDGNVKAGSHTVTFDASNYATGVYFYQLVTENQSLIKKMMLIK
jgi:hypothetical protein